MAKTRPGKRDLEFYTITGTNKVVRAGDCVLMKSSEPDKRPYVARVEKIEADTAGNVMVKVRWYYRPEEASGGRRQFHGAKELFLSDQYDTQSAYTIEGKCIVHSFRDYTKLEDVGAEDYYSCFEYKAGAKELTPDRVAVVMTAKTAGDCVLMKSSEPDKLPSVACVERLETDMEGNIMVKVRWYYRPEEASFGRREFHGAKELYLSDHYDTQSANTIERKCIVHSFRDYTKLDDVGAEDYYFRYEYIVGTKKLTPDRVPVYCKCEMPCNPDYLMIQCDDCKDWFHPGCVKMTTAQAEQLSNYLCDECSS